MLKNKLIGAVLSLFFLLNYPGYSKENIGTPQKKDENNTTKSAVRAADCDPATSSFDLQVNNVKARLLNGGDMWWDLAGNPKYEIPKGTNQFSLFAGSIWIGGIDAGGQLKVAGQTYRQSGNDFFPGALDAEGIIDKETCSDWDRHFSVMRSDIDLFLEDWEDNNQIDKKIPDAILNWPGKNNPNLSFVGNQDLAPFHDELGDGVYDPQTGDYPIFDHECSNAKPDQMVWWVYNDKGNVKNETNSEALGIEIQATAFAFITNDEINDMTFYRYNVINKSTLALDSAYMANWVDADLGFYNDDFVGCDTARGLGICYNGDAIDGPGASSYGANPPLVGTDFFKGPKDPDNPGQRLGMSNFLFYNNDFTVTGNPTRAPHYYGYMSGTWKDGAPFTCGGVGYGGAQTCNYLFPGDPQDQVAWSECSSSNTPSDRRYLQSAGPFRLLPGAVDTITVGVVWVRPKESDRCPSFNSLIIADEKAQVLFDNCFELIEGPIAPKAKFRELDKEIILSITDYRETENYDQVDPTILPIVRNDTTGTLTDSTYTFQGYIIYQLRDAVVSASELSDRNKARILASIDIKDGVGAMVNYEFDPEFNANIPFVKAEAAEDNGIKHTFKITRDLFALNDPKLVNHKTYYYTIVPYAYNNYKTFNPKDDIQGQQKPYLEARRIKINPPYAVIPHKTTPLQGGTKIQVEYGSQPEIKRIEGKGNGGLNLDMTEASLADALAGVVSKPVYKAGMGPVDVKIYDPVAVPKATFRLEFIDTMGGKTMSNTATWCLYKLDDNGVKVDSECADTSINAAGEYLTKWGLSIDVSQVPLPGRDRNSNQNGLIEATMVFKDPLYPWLTGISDVDNSTLLNWILAGTGTGDKTGEDDNQFYESILGGIFAPARLASDLTTAPVNAIKPFENLYNQRASMDSLYSVDLVITSDKSKWTKGLVLEMSEDPKLAEGGAEKFYQRKSPGVDKDGSPMDTGVSWFPGYAINIETGERLNICFGEDSWLIGENGNDMLWNPTSSLVNTTSEAKYGGKHYIYIMSTKYDGGSAFQFELENTKLSQLRNYIGEKMMWVGVPRLANGAELLPYAQGLIPSDVKIRIRVARPYQRMKIDGSNGGYPVYEFSTEDLAPVTSGAAPENELADSILQQINIVPNPYYAFSAYETNKVDNRVKLTNLPDKCTISIYSIDGVLIRKFGRGITTNTSIGDDGLDSSLDWDLKNDKGVPIASGMYLIHINADGIGERIVKWFGAMRPIDLENF